MDKNNPDFLRIKLLLNQKEYSNKYIVGVKKQLLVYWQEIGLIEDKRNHENTWGKFSLIDILWMGIILELRTFGFPNEKIKICHKELFSTSESDRILTKLEYASIKVLAYSTPIFITIDEIGSTIILNDFEYIDQLQKGLVKHHLILSLNQLIKLNINVLFNEPNFSAFTGLSKDEIQVMLILRSDSYQSIQITKKNGEIDMIEGTERISERDRIIDILKQHEYQNIEIKQANGKVVLITRTVKQKTK